MTNWRNQEDHRQSQAAGRGGVFADYRLRIASVVRDYGMAERGRRRRIRGLFTRPSPPERAAAMLAALMLRPCRVLNRCQIERHGTHHDRPISGLSRGPRQGSGRLGHLRQQDAGAAAHRQERAHDGVPHGRPPAAHHRRCGWRRGHELLRLGGGGCRRPRCRGGAAREGRRHGGARLPCARRRAAGQGPDRDQRSGRQPARVVPRRRDHGRAVQARPLRSPASAPARSAWATW